MFNNYDLVGWRGSVDIPLWRWLVITPHIDLSVALSKLVGEKYPNLKSDPNTGEDSIKRNYAHPFGFGGGLGIGALIYRGPNAAIKLGMDGSMGRLKGNKAYPYGETFGLVTGGMELRVFPQSDFGISLEVGGGAYCSITNNECYGTLLTGLRLLINVTTHKKGEPL